MNDSLNSFLKKYAGIILFSCVFMAIYIITHDVAGAEGKEKLKIISDGFAIPGLLVASYGRLIWVYDKGALDGVLYAMNTMWLSLVPGGRNRVGRYSDFVEKKSASRNSEFIQFLIVGGVFIILAILLTVIYNFVK